MPSAHQHHTRPSVCQAKQVSSAAYTPGKKRRIAATNAIIHLSSTPPPFAAIHRYHAPPTPLREDSKPEPLSQRAVRLERQAAEAGVDRTITMRHVTRCSIEER
jgi:hypothetical protein